MSVASTTAYDLIKLALKTAGVTAVGQTPQAEDSNDALTILNSMVANWRQNRWLIYHLVDVSAPATGALSYSVGLVGDFNVLRPDRIEAAYARLLVAPVGSGSGPLDYPLAVMQTYEEYSEIGIKRLTSFPSIVFYDASLPLGTLYVWPVPNDKFELHIIMKDTLQEFDSLTTKLTLPPEYFEALFYNLVGRLQLLYQLPVNPGVAALAGAALNQIKIANHRVPNLRMPIGVTRAGGWAIHGAGGVFEGTFTLDEDVLGPA